MGFLQPGVAADSAISFNRDVRPILSDNCFACHGFDAGQRKAKLRLDTADGAFKENEDGVAPIKPGDLAQSEAWRRIVSDDRDEVMPPPKSHKQLTAAQKEIIKRWIEAGAAWQGHWAFIKPERPALPTVQQPEWVRAPIDHFILASLEREGLAPSPEADRAALIRRVTLDLTGLSPTPEEVRAFLEDASPRAYEAVVERLLRSPHYGERMALPWLDAARYADTHGYQKDNERTMWAWRDWVIDAFNANMRFDQFTIEQIAGDLLPNATLAQRVATGFNRNHRINAEAGAIEEEYRAEYVADRVDTTATVWLGLTVACARCHDHKFDPITQRDYYRMFAFFNNVAENGVDGVGPSPVPQLNVPVPGFEDAIARAQNRVNELNARWLAEGRGLKEEQARWEGRLRGKLDGLEGSQVWSVAEPVSIASAEKIKFERLDDGSILGSEANPLNDDHTIVLPLDAGRATAIRLEALTHETHERGSLARSFDGNFVLSGFEVEVTRPGAAPQRLAVREAVADYSQPGWPVAAAIDTSNDTGWAVDGGSKRENRAALFILASPVSGTPGTRLTVRLRYRSKEERCLIGRFRLATTDRTTPTLETMEALPQSVIAALKMPPENRSTEQEEIVASAFRSSAPQLAGVRAEIEAARRELAALRRSAFTTVMVMEEQTPPRETFVLQRGNYARPGEKVTPGVPASLPPIEAATASRLDFARWLVDPANPLTARVAVNRYWQMYFGTGLVKTTEDFGTQGEWPSHPELLDWLATEFIRTGWDVQAMQRLIVTSATYRQSSRVPPALLERDPENRLIARGPRFRLPGHFIRDQALAAAGLLVPKIGGPPVKPYQPAGLWEGVAGINSNTTKYQPDSGADLHRRSLYTFWKRAVPPPAMMIFDAADREVCSVKRRVTNTPLQALNLLNDVTYVEASRALAARVLAVPGIAREERLRHMWRRVLAREPEPHEVRRLDEALAAYRARFRASPAAAAELIRVGESSVDAQLDPVELAAWTTLAAVILNLDETLTKE